MSLVTVPDEAQTWIPEDRGSRLILSSLLAASFAAQASVGWRDRNTVAALVTSLGCALFLAAALDTERRRAATTATGLTVTGLSVPATPRGGT